MKPRSGTEFDPLPLSTPDSLSIISESNELNSPPSTNLTVVSSQKDGMAKKKMDRIGALSTTEYSPLSMEAAVAVRPGAKLSRTTLRIQSLRKSIPQKMGSDSKFWKHLRVLLPLFLLVVYSGLGGLLFWHLEGTSSTEQLRLKSNQTFSDLQNNSVVELAYLIEENNGTMSADELLKFLVKYAERLGLQPADIKERTFWGSVFFVGTVYTTIGYGNIAPITTGGRAFTVVFAMLGIPLVLYVLADLGKLFCKGIWHCYNVFNIYVLGRCCHHMARRRIGEFPLALAIALTFGWVFFCSWLFTLWEDWDIFTSLYFFFQSLTTIGFGDITPKRPRYMVFSFVLIIIGLSLVSMCWNLVQLKLEHLVDELSKRIEENQAAVDEEENGAIGENAHDAVNKLAHEQDNWLAPLLGHSTKSRLIHQWEYKMAHKTRGIQTERPMMSHASTTAFTACMTRSTQTGGGADALELEPMAETPLKEVKRTTSTDELRGMLRDINFILSDCRDIVHRSPSAQTTPIKKHHFY